MSSTRVLPRLAFTPGEPAGIGPDLAVMLAQRELPAQLVAVASPELLRERAALLGLPLELLHPPLDRARPHRPGTLCVEPIPLGARADAGCLDPSNGDYVLATLRRAVEGCLSGEYDALVTGPVHKGVINDAGHPFTGHTEYISGLCGGILPVMMLAAPGLRVALVTTHLPLAAVPAAITRELLEEVVRILYRDLIQRFGIPSPRILVCGLNPHAGEGGHLGREEIEVIEPVLTRLRGEGMEIIGPLPADTLFTPSRLEGADAVLAMYHDQGLPVLKHLGFGRAVNITLGLPIIRTSVDHGTALELAGRGSASDGSLMAAIQAALEMAASARGAGD